MASEVEICNSALALLGDFRIEALDQGTERARKCAERYDPLRRRLLRGHPWNFATRQAELAREDIEPVYQFDNSFALPADFIRVRDVDTQQNGDTTSEYRIQGQSLLSDFDAIYLTYVADIDEVSLFSADFSDAFVYSLAAELAIPIAQSRTLMQDYGAEAKRLVRRAKSTDSIEDYSDRFPSGTWNLYRFGGIGRNFRRRF